jgi:hypothetical protein
MSTIDTVLVDGSPVEKSGFRAFEKSRSSFVLANAAEIGALNMAGYVSVEDGETGAVYVVDAAYTGPAADNYIQSLDGFWFRLYNPLESLTAADIADLLSASGGLPNNGLKPAVSNGLFKATKAGTVQDVGGSDIEAALDAALGTGWKVDPTGLSAGSICAGLPANKQRTFGHTARVFLMADGSVQATGAATSGVNGEIGGNTITRPNAVAPASVATFTKVFLGQSASYLIDDQGYAWSWGMGTYGALGHGNTNNLTRPTRIPFFVTNSLTVTDIITPATGDDTNAYCAIFICSNGKAYYTGYNAQADAGLGNTTQQNAPVEWASGALSGTIIGGAISDYPLAVYCWNSAGTARGAGSNAYGQQGIGTTTAIAGNLSTAIALSGVTKIVSTERGTLVLHSGGISYAGQNSDGAGGLGVTTPANLTSWSAVPFTGFTPADIAIGGGTQPTCAAISTTKRLRLWGENGIGSQGTGGTTDVLSPTEPSAPFQGSVDKVEVIGQAAYCAVIVQAGDLLYAAGYNGVANLSVGATGNATTFAQVQGIPAGAIIYEWAVFGAVNTWGIVARTSFGTYAGGYGANGENGVGNTLNLHVLQRIDFPSVAGPAGSSGADGADFQIDGQGLFSARPSAGSVADGFVYVATDTSPFPTLYRNNGGTWSAGAPFFKGREVELQKSVTHVQWRYVGDVSWTDLVPLTDITGADSTVPGPTGPESWATPVAYASGISAVSTAPRTQVVYLGETYVCITGHTTTGSFDGAKWIKVAQKGADGAGTGDVVGPASALNNRVARFDGTTGKLIKDGGTDMALVQGAIGLRTDVATASSPDIGVAATSHINLTGTTTVVSFVTPTGRLYLQRANAAFTLTHGSGITTPTAANITTTAGDTWWAYATAANTVTVFGYQRADGTPLAGGGGGGSNADILLSQFLI